MVVVQPAKVVHNNNLAIGARRSASKRQQPWTNLALHTGGGLRTPPANLTSVCPS
jgi:hypothetical protein